ncbi:unnamed protein product [Lampetra planeri]
MSTDEFRRTRQPQSRFEDQPSSPAPSLLVLRGGLADPRQLQTMLTEFPTSRCPNRNDHKRDGGQRKATTSSTRAPLGAAAERVVAVPARKAGVVTPDTDRATATSKADVAGSSSSGGVWTLITRETRIARETRRRAMGDVRATRGASPAELRRLRN